MGAFSWIGFTVLFFWALGAILRIGGSAIHLLLIIAAIVFVVDMFFGRSKRAN